jgi:hypothetical protein
LKSKDLEKLAQFVHPQKGLRFTPYSHIDATADKVFSAVEISGLIGDAALIRLGRL